MRERELLTNAGNTLHPTFRSERERECKCRLFLLFNYVSGVRPCRSYTDVLISLKVYQATSGVVYLSGMILNYRIFEFNHACVTYVCVCLRVCVFLGEQNLDPAEQSKWTLIKINRQGDSISIGSMWHSFSICPPLFSLCSSFSLAPCIGPTPKITSPFVTRPIDSSKVLYYSQLICNSFTRSGRDEFRHETSPGR